jgi:hypothetical protein
MQTKVFGERHTGTNAISAFISLNFDTRLPYYEFLGWKHRRAPKKKEWSKYDCSRTLFVYTVRNPYTWLKAMHRLPYYYHQPQIAKLRFRDFLLHSVEDYENYIQMWNKKYRSYIKMSRQVPHALIIRMEDFLADQEAVYERLQKVLPAKGAFQRYDKYAHGQGVEQDAGKLQSATELPPVPDETYALINRELDPKLMKYFGYQYAHCKVDENPFPGTSHAV